MTDADDPLSELLVEGDEVDRQALARALKGRVAIDRKTGRFLMDDGYANLDAKRKLLVVLLAAKASALLGVSDSEAISYKQIVSLSGLPGGTAAPGLKGLKEARLVDQNEAKAYYVNGAALRRAMKMLENGVAKS